jgi:hypothetical protein
MYHQKNPRFTYSNLQFLRESKSILDQMDLTY